jgi:hypothetical protein
VIRPDRAGYVQQELAVFGDERAPRRVAGSSAADIARIKKPQERGWQIRQWSTGVAWH